MANSHCLNLMVLRALVVGGADDTDLRQAEEHILECPSCFEKLKEINHETSDHWPTPAKEQAVDRALIPRLEAMRPADATAPPDSTPGDPTVASDYRPPEQIGPYRIGPLLGAGGVGLVYAAEDVELLRSVAVKILRPEHARNPVARQRFLHEARAVAALNDDHIMPIHHVGEDQDVPYLVMPRLEGKSLAVELADRRRLPVADAVQIGLQVAEGLAVAHQRGMIHRDIKPGNLWREPNGRVRILDFGLARFLDSDTRLTQTGLIVGTPAYMAPEQADDAQVDHRCDLFSLGCVLYQMLAGRVPFPGTTPFAVFKAMAAGEPQSLSKIDSQIPQRLSDLVSRLLQHEPSKRPATALEVLRELQSAQSPLRKPWWHRRRLLQAIGTFAAGTTAIGGWLAVRPKLGDSSSTAHGFRVRFEHNSYGGLATDFYFEPPNPVTMEMYATGFVAPGRAGHVAGLSSHFSIHVTEAQEWSLGVETSSGFRQVLGGPIANGRRVHLAAIRDRDEIRMYVDGRKAGSLAVPAGSYTPPKSPFCIGSGFAGELSEIRVSKSVRYRDDFTPAARFEPDADTLALYHCNEGSGDQLQDSSDNGHHMKLVGATWVRGDGELARPEPASQPIPPGAGGNEFALKIDNTIRIAVKDVEFDDSGPVTIEALVTQNAEQLVGPVGIMGPGQRLTPFLSTVGWCCTFYTPRVTRHLECRDPVQIGRLYHLACVFDRGLARWYVDGRLVDRFNFGNNARLKQSAQPFFVGGGLNGTICEVRVSDVARYLRNFEVPLRHEPDDNTLLLLHCDEGSGEWLRDASKHRRDVHASGLIWLRRKK